MKRNIQIMLGIILALPLVLAMYGGETKTIEFSFETDNCTIVPNVSEGINFTFNGNNVLIEPAINFVGNFNITCYDWLTKEVKEEKKSYGSGGYYTYPWRKNQTNVTEDNETIIDEVFEELEEVEKELSEISTDGIDEGRFKRVLLITAVIVILGFIILLIFRVKNNNEKPNK